MSLPQYFCLPNRTRLYAVGVTWTAGEGRQQGRSGAAAQERCVGLRGVWWHGINSDCGVIVVIVLVAVQQSRSELEGFVVCDSEHRETLRTQASLCASAALQI